MRNYGASVNFKRIITIYYIYIIYILYKANFISLSLPTSPSCNEEIKIKGLTGVRNRQYRDETTIIKYMCT